MTTIQPFGRWKLRHILTLPVALMLWPIVAYDYRQRRLKKRPDKWHWADVTLLRMGWAAKLIGGQSWAMLYLPYPPSRLRLWTVFPWERVALPSVTSVGDFGVPQFPRLHRRGGR